MEEGEDNEERPVDIDDIENMEMEDREELRRKIGTKKLAKLEEKAAKRRQNEEIQREREEKREQEELAYQERKKREAEEERLEKEREEEERLAKEEEEKREYEEYLKLKEAFTVDEEGQDEALSAEESQNLLLEFVEYIKKAKVVVLEDLAAQFNLKTQVSVLLLWIRGSFFFFILMSLFFVEGCYKSSEYGARDGSLDGSHGRPRQVHLYLGGGAAKGQAVH